MPRPGDFPVGLTVSMAEWAAEPGFEHRIDEFRARTRTCTCTRRPGDDFVGVQAYSRTRVGETGVIGPEPGVEVLPMGYEYWPDGGRGVGPPRADVTGLPIYVTENGIGTDDDAERIRYVRDSLAGDRADDRRRHRRPRLLPLVAPRQLRVGVRLPDAIRDRRRRPNHAGAHGEAERPVAGRGDPGQRGHLRPTPPSRSPTQSARHNGVVSTGEGDDRRRRRRGQHRRPRWPVPRPRGLPRGEGGHRRRRPRRVPAAPAPARRARRRAPRHRRPRGVQAHPRVRRRFR